MKKNRKISKIDEIVIIFDFICILAIPIISFAVGINCIKDAHMFRGNAFAIGVEYLIQPIVVCLGYYILYKIQPAIERIAKKIIK